MLGEPLPRLLVANQKSDLLDDLEGGVVDVLDLVAGQEREKLHRTNLPGIFRGFSGDFPGIFRGFSGDFPGCPIGKGSRQRRSLPANDNCCHNV
jgi:hypothetical protein